MYKTSSIFLNISFVGVALILTGCTHSTGYSKGYTTAPTMEHQYNISAVDISGKPISDVVIEVRLASETESTHTQKTTTCITNNSGRCPPVIYEVSHDQSVNYTTRYSSTASAKGIKDGYYPAKASGTSNTSGKLNSKIPTELQLTMIEPINYLDNAFATSKADVELRERVMKFLEIIRLQSVLVDAELSLNGIRVSEFKGKKYLRLTIDSATVFNSLKINKYDMGKRLFDESIRKILNPLNDHISPIKNYYGYDIIIYGHSRNFVEKYASTNKIEYRFLLPENAVRRYKDKDISGQALLDASMLLMDDERVEFKLQ